MTTNRSYTVVLMDKPPVGGIMYQPPVEEISAALNRSMMSFVSKDEFEQWYDTQQIAERKWVIAKGVTNEKGMDICKESPSDPEISACFERVRQLAKAGLNADMNIALLVTDLEQVLNR